jgi:ribosomal protein L7Ae-like RNA K-turn-binding protein
MESRTTSALRLLGLARRAGAVAPGTDAVRRAIREGEARLVLIAGDASSTQVAKVRTTMHDKAIPQVILGDRNTLGAALGLGPLTAVAVTSGSLAEKLVRELEVPRTEGSTDAVEA